MKTTISAVSALEILDSRGNPTVRAFCKLDNGISVSASVPSGASMAVARAAAEAVDLPLYQYLGGTGTVRLPVPMMNILNGGKRSGRDVMIVVEPLVIGRGLEADLSRRRYIG